MQQGDRVALLAPNHISYFDILFACMKTGTVFVPLNWRLRDEELCYILDDSARGLVAVHHQFKEKLTLIEKTYPTLQISDETYIDKWEASETRSVASMAEEDPLAMIYTGGTTGKPKGAVLSHRSILWNALNTIISWDLSKEDTTLTCIPMFHTGGLNALSIPVLLAGGTVVVSEAFEPAQAVRDLVTYRCTIVLFVPTMYHMIIQTERFRHEHFTDMKVFLSGGAPCPIAIYEAFAAKTLDFKEGYGLTEAGPNNFFITPKEGE